LFNCGKPGSVLKLFWREWLGESLTVSKRIFSVVEMVTASKSADLVREVMML